MKKLLPLAFLLATTFLFAQSENDKKIFLDSLNRETTEGNHKYYRIIKDYQLDTDSYLYSDYYYSGQLLKEGQSLKKEYFLPINEVKEYYENGNLKETTTFNEKSQKSGKFNSWYPNGKNKIEGEYIFTKSKKNEDEFTLKVNSFWNEDGIQKITNGNGFYEINNDLEEPNTISSEKGTYKNGLKNGLWQGKCTYTSKTFTELEYTEKYDNGNLISGKSKDNNNKEYTYEKNFVESEPQKGMMHFMKYVQKNYKTPDVDKNLDGRVIIEFVVEKNGELSNFVILNDLGFGTAQEAIRMLKTYPDLWNPGLNKGMPVRVRYSLPIKLKITAR